MEINIPKREEALFWVLNEDGSAIPLTTFIAEKEASDWEEPSADMRMKAAVHGLEKVKNS